MSAKFYLGLLQMINNKRVDVKDKARPTTQNLAGFTPMTVRVRPPAYSFYLIFTAKITHFQKSNTRYFKL
jgi:hypothetical protein